MDSILEYFSDLITEKRLDIDKYKNLFDSEKWDEMFQQALSDDFVEIVEFLYTEMGCKFYLSSYTDRMNKDVLHLLNDDKSGERGFRLVYDQKDGESFQYLLNMRRYSKLVRDKSGFYYVFTKK